MRTIATDERLFIQIKNNISEIKRISQSLHEFGASQHLPFNIIHSLDLGLDEILNNIITHGYNQHDEGQITIQIRQSDSQIIVVIEDQGKEFNPLKMKAADTASKIEKRPIGGLGIHLTRNFIDEIQYKYENKKNCLTLIKLIREN
jgi:serine/threonine-protein kinase RsbW